MIWSAGRSSRAFLTSAATPTTLYNGPFTRMRMYLPMADSRGDWPPLARW